MKPRTAVTSGLAAAGLLTAGFLTVGSHLQDRPSDDLAAQPAVQTQTFTRPLGGPSEGMQFERDVAVAGSDIDQAPPETPTARDALCNAVPTQEVEQIVPGAQPGVLRPQQGPSNCDWTNGSITLLVVETAGYDGADLRGEPMVLNGIDIGWSDTAGAAEFASRDLHWRVTVFGSDGERPDVAELESLASWLQSNR